MPRREDIESILIIGSGPIVIGQACEFDYSGSQAIAALKEEGYRIILVNPNPATVMTTPGIADIIYIEPLTLPYLEEIIKTENPDALLPTMGGQTGLNLTLELHDRGVLKKYGVECIGASIDSIRLAEDRGAFKKLAESIGLESPESILCSDITTAKEFQRDVGFPLVIRPSFTLGGQGGAIAYTREEFLPILEKALSESPVHSALIEESLVGWKEFEMEVIRDKADNAIVVCSIENIDPMGVHTGDSITIAPIQTLSDRAYQTMRTASLEVLRAVGVDCGGSNVQFALHPETERMLVIEMNPRVSRSSALASKATGFPIARCSARLAVGYTLDEISNEITGKTVSCFEPALDYCAVKVPRFEIDKFPTGYKELGTQMKSVGEALALGRTFTEALNKAIRSSEIGYEGLRSLRVESKILERMLNTLDPMRLFAAYTEIDRGGEKSISEISKRTGFESWFLYELYKQTLVEEELTNSKKEIVHDKELLLRAKQFGFSDIRIAQLTGKEERIIRNSRKAQGIPAVYHFVDTCAGEFESVTPYFYSTYGEIDEGVPLGEKAVVILASGPNRIGQGLEFDTCCTLASLAYRQKGRKTIIINSNPETVSTDYNISDRLYIEPLTAEHVLDIMEKEGVKDVVVQLGGQTPLNMVETLEQEGAKVIGTSSKSIMNAEDRRLFAALIKDLEIKQPKNTTAYSPEEVLTCSETIGFPILLRPSFVLGGKSMVIAFSEDELREFLKRDIEISQQKPLLVDQFLEDAFEYDVDALCDGRNVYICGIMQHIESAGVHSGDSACVYPPYKSEPRIQKEMIETTKIIATRIGVVGFLNIQYAVKEGQLYILEVNPRASRTVPFLSKASGVNLVEAAVKVWEGVDLEQQGFTKKGIGQGECSLGWAVKEAVFSFSRFPDADPLLGPEMKSTGEVMGIGISFGEAFAKAQAAVGSPLPVSGRAFISVHKDDRETILPVVQRLHGMGFHIAATRGTAQFLFHRGIFAEIILKIHEGHPHVIDHMRSGRIDLMVHTPLGKFSQKGDEEIRVEAVKRKIPYTTTTSAAEAAVQGIEYLLKGETRVRHLEGAWDLFV